MRFWTWYRRFYVLVNVPILLAITELVVSHYDVANHPPFDRANDLVHAFERYDTAPPAGEPVMVVLGSSVMLSGVDQRDIEAKVAFGGKPMRVYNFSLGGACLDDEFDLLELLADRGVHPQVVVLGINLYGIIDRHRDVLRSALPRYSPYLYFHRSRIRTSLNRAIKKGGLEWRPYGQFTNVQKVSDRLLENATRAMINDFGHRTALEFPMIARIRELERTLAARGTSLHVVVLPMNPAATDRLDDYRELTAAIRAASPADTLDVSTGYTPDLFHDEGHFNDAGRAKLTGQVVEWLAHRKELTAR